MKKAFNILLILCGAICAIIGAVGFFSSTGEPEDTLKEEVKDETKGENLAG